MNNFKYFLGVIIFLVSICFKSNAQKVRVEAKLDTSSILMGDQTRFHLSIHLPAGDTIGFPKLTDTINSKLLIVNKSKLDTVFDKNDLSKETIKQSFTITSFDAGTYLIPAFVFHTKNGVFKTNELALKVLSVAVDTTKAIYDIKQPLAVSYTFIDWLKDHWPWVVFPLLGLLIIAGIIYYLRRRPKKQVSVKEVKPDVPAHTLALSKLNKLRDKKLWQQDQVKQYHSELSGIVREYLEKRYAIKAQEQTTEEIFASLKYIDMTEENRNMLRPLLMIADLAKFAREKPLPADNEQSMEGAINFVTKTQKEIRPIDYKEGDSNNGHV